MGSSPEDIRRAFGALRSALASGPDAWPGVLRAIESIDPRVAAEQLVPHALGEVRRWPARVRVIPRRWFARLAERGVPVGLELAGAIALRELSNERYWCNPLERYARAMAGVEWFVADGERPQARDLARLARIGELDRMTRFSLVGSSVHSEHMEVLLGERGFGWRVAELDVARAWLGDDLWWVERAARTELPALRALSLRDSGVRTEHFEVMRSAGWFDYLERLDLSECYVGDEAMEQWATSGGSGAPASLCLRGQSPVFLRSEARLTERGVVALASNPAMRSVRRLDLSENALNDRAAAALASSEHLTGLRELRLVFCGLSPVGVDAILASPLARSLERLVLGYDRGLDPSIDFEAGSVEIVWED